MSSDIEELSDGDNSSEGYMLWEEEVDGQRVGLAFQAAAAPELLFLMDALEVGDPQQLLTVIYALLRRQQPPDCWPWTNWYKCCDDYP